MLLPILKPRCFPCADQIRTANEGNLFVSWVAGLVPQRRLPEGIGGMVSCPQELNVSSDT